MTEPSDGRPILYTDLDDTLFQTARKMTEPACETRLAAEAMNGRHSYMSRTQARMTRWLLRSTRMIPVTARSTEALARCRIPFDSWRIAANGAVILDRSGEPDRTWSERVRAICDAHAPELAEIHARLGDFNPDGRFRHWIVDESGVPVYFCVKSNGAEHWLDEAARMLEPLAGDRFARHRNGNNLSYTPKGISKLHAVRHLDERIGGDALRLGMGDSLTDLPFMGVCDMMMIPPGSQIAAAIDGA